MELKVQNFMRIKDATIAFDGITVIAGENNTSKSTIGKIMFALFSSFRNLDSEVISEIKKSISRGLLTEVNFKSSFDIEEELSAVKKMTDSFYKLRNNLKKENINQIISDYGEISKSEDELFKYINKILKYDPHRVESLIVKRIFTDEFNSQYHSLLTNANESHLSLEIKGKKLKVDIDKEKFILEKPFFLEKNCILIDDPFILDNINRNFDKRGMYDFLFGINQSQNHSEFLLRVLSEKKGVRNGDLITKDIMRNRVLNFIDIIKQEIEGDFVLENNKILFHNMHFKENLRLSNLSTGVKSLAILLKLLEDGYIDERSMIVLDEPEIHLHPKWQLIYAELLIQLQKEFDLNVLITTHSPYFLNAIEVYSQKHEISNRCNYYLAKLNDQFASFEQVNGSVNKIYKELAEPFDTLQTEEEENNA